MNDHDLTAAIVETLDECPKCHGKLEQQSRYGIECKACGFRIRTSSKLSDYIEALIAGIGLATGLGVLIGLELARLTLQHVATHA